MREEIRKVEKERLEIAFLTVALGIFLIIHWYLFLRLGN